MNKIKKLFLIATFFIGFQSYANANGPYGLPFPQIELTLYSSGDSYDGNSEYFIYEDKSLFFAMDLHKWASENLIIGSDIGVWKWCRLESLSGTTSYVYHHQAKKMMGTVLVSGDIKNKVRFDITKKIHSCENS